jgi:hypothetical protein
MTDFFWTGANSTDWEDYKNWHTPGINPIFQTVPDADSGDVAIFNKGAGVSLSGGGGATLTQIISGTAVALSSGFEMSNGDDGGLQIDGGGSLNVPSGALVEDVLPDDQDVVGLTSSGKMAVTTGGQYLSIGLIVGADSGASGTVTADGAQQFQVMQSSLGASGDGVLVIGEHGDGSVEISDGTSFAAATTILGQYQGSNGELEIDESTFAPSIGGGTLYVGQAGTAKATIEAGSTAAMYHVTIGADGTLVVTGGAAGLTSTLRVVDDLTLAYGTIDVSGFGQVIVGNATGADGAVSIAGATLPGLGTIDGDVVVQSGGVLEAVQALPGTLRVNGNITGTGTIEPVMTLEANGVIGPGVTIQFSPSQAMAVGDLVLDVPTGDQGTIVDFGKGNEIDVRGYQYTTAVFKQGPAGGAGTLTLSGGLSQPLQLKVQGDYGPHSFKATPGISDTGIPNTIVTLDGRATSNPKDDFLDNGTSDVLLQDGSTVAAWIMQNGLYSDGNILSTAVAGWRVVGAGDFNDDGTSDVLLQNGGTVANWIMQNGQYESGNILTTAAAGWNVVGTGDFTGNGTDDVLLQNGGTVADWIMQNGQYESGNILTTAAAGWNVVGTGDFTGTGTSDVLLQNGGTVADWIIKGGAYQSGNILTTGAAGWKVVGTGDFTGTGTDDVLLQNGGTVVDWIIKDGAYQSGNIITTGAAGWSVVGTGNYNGDGASDVLLQNGGAVVDWIMKDGLYASGNVLTTAASGWNVAHS